MEFDNPRVNELNTVPPRVRAGHRYLPLQLATPFLDTNIHTVHVLEDARMSSRKKNGMTEPKV